MYEKGLDKFTKELDIEYYAKSLRNLQTMVSAMMDDSERFISKFQHCNSLTLLGLDTESDSEDEVLKGMPSYLNK